MVKTYRTEPPELIDNGLVICEDRHKFQTFGFFYEQSLSEASFALVLLELLSLIVTYRILRFLLKPLRQPKVVSKILGGIILGPSILSRNKMFRSYIFPQRSEFLLKNIGVIGFMYFLFLYGVKMDLLALKKVGKKHWYIAFVGVIVPLCSSAAIAVTMRESLDTELAKFSSIIGVCSSFSITSFPVLYPIVRELNLLSSDIGRMALSTAIVSDIIGINGVAVFEASKQAEGKTIAVLWYFISLIIVSVSIVVGGRQAMLWIVRSTPQGKPVDQIYVIAILVGVLIAGFFADMFGLAIANGPLWFGLAVPDGPPLGATIVEKSETIIEEMLLPFSFLYVGITTDVASINGQWSHLQPFFFMALAGYLLKMVFTFVATRFFDMSMRDGLTLALIMSLRGEVELLLFIHWMDFKMIGKPHFTLMVLLTMTVTALFTPMISILYDPTRPYMVTKRRNIQHNPPNSEFHIVACIHGEESVAGLVNLLLISNPTVNSPFLVYALFLVELQGRAVPVLIDHDKNQEDTDHNSISNSIHNALKISLEDRGECISLHSYTTITPKRSMYQDICELALVKKASLIILPIQRQLLDNLNLNQPMNYNVLAHAPCSVGILADKGTHRNTLVSGSLGRSPHHFAVLFLGGADAREALAYADRMAANPDVSLTVIRFLSHENEGDIEMEKKLDDGLVTWFWVKNEGNDKVVYREVIVKNGRETIAAIQSMDKDDYELWIVGRKHGINPVLLRGLTDWSKSNELGVIGEYLASQDFGVMASVLAVQQQILRGQQRSSCSLIGRFLCT